MAHSRLIVSLPESLVFNKIVIRAIYLLNFLKKQAVIVNISNENPITARQGCSWAEKCLFVSGI